MTEDLRKKKFQKICEGCLCELLNDPEIIISQNVFHSNICTFHIKYCQEVNEEKKLYEEKGINFFVDLVEFNLIKYKIRDQTMVFMIKYLNDYFYKNK